MTIKSVNVYFVRPRWGFVEIVTDTGVAGWGEAVLEGHAKAVLACVEEYRDYLIGKDPSRIEDFWETIYRAGFYRGRAGARQAEGDSRGDAPENVHVTPWREADGSRVVHFLNSTGAPEPVAGECPDKGVPPVPFPLPAKDIVVTLPAEGATTAVATSPDFAGERPLSVAANPDGTLTFVLSRELMKAYALVRVR